MIYVILGTATALSLWGLYLFLTGKVNTRHD